MELTKRVLLVHGIRAKDKGTKSIGKLKKILLNFSPTLFKSIKLASYGYVLIPITNKKAVTSIIDILKKYTSKSDYIIIVAYSNGCWASVQAAEMGYKIDHLILISPALHRQHEFPSHIKKIHVYYSSGDDIVEFGRAYRFFVNILPWNWKVFGGKPHEWGAMGKYGYKGTDKRVINYNMGNEVGHFWYRDNLLIKSIALNIISSTKGNKK